MSKIIKVLDPQAGNIQETHISDNAADPTADGQLPAANALFEARPGKHVSLSEASTTNEFPTLLRDGIKTIAFDRYAGTPVTWNLWAMVEPSDKQSEDWVEENQIGELPIVPENGPFPEFKQDLDRTVNIRNYKRGGIISVTEEMIRFNRTNLIKRQAAQLGRAAARTREQACYSVLTTTANYVRTTADGDNDVGANTAATTFSAAGLNLALSVLRTMKDRKSGAYLGVEPNTLIVAPQLEMAAKQLLLSPVLQIPGDGVTTAKVYGTGATNPFRGLIDTIIVSPRVGASYQWALLERQQAVVLQEVEGLQVLQESAGRVEHEGYFKYDNIRFRVRDWYGVGMLNDRFAYFSSSTTAPAVG